MLTFGNDFTSSNKKLFYIFNWKEMLRGSLTACIQIFTKIFQIFSQKTLCFSLSANCCRRA